MDKIIIPGRFPGMNEIIAEAKKGNGRYQPYAQMKDEYTNLVKVLGCKCKKYNAVDIEITWFEKDMRRDPDNIAGGGSKLILDGLVKAGVIPNDT
jgi:hypothetical protein